MQGAGCSCGSFTYCKYTQYAAHIQPHTLNTSPNTKTQTLDATADGYGRGEACRTLIIGTLDEHHQPLALLANSAVNSNGTASTLTAPHGPSQQALLQQALNGIDHAHIAALQLHANGTQLGDAVEVNAAMSVLSDAARSRPFLLHTCKGSTGHQEAGSGIASLQEALVVLHEHTTSPALHLRTLNPHVEMAMVRRAAHVARQHQPVVLLQASVAMGVSSFGAQGTNAHAVLYKGGMDDTRVMNKEGGTWQSSRFWVLPPTHVRGCLFVY